MAYTSFLHAGSTEEMSTSNPPACPPSAGRRACLGPVSINPQEFMLEPFLPYAVPLGDRDLLN